MQRGVKINVEPRRVRTGWTTTRTQQEAAQKKKAVSLQHCNLTAVECKLFHRFEGPLWNGTSLELLSKERLIAVQNASKFEQFGKGIRFSIGFDSADLMRCGDQTVEETSRSRRYHLTAGGPCSTDPVYKFYWIWSIISAAAASKPFVHDVRDTSEQEGPWYRYQWIFPWTVLVGSLLTWSTKQLKLMISGRYRASRSRRPPEDLPGPNKWRLSICLKTNKIWFMETLGAVHKLVRFQVTGSSVETSRERFRLKSMRKLKRRNVRAPLTD